MRLQYSLFSDQILTSMRKLALNSVILPYLRTAGEETELKIRELASVREVSSPLHIHYSHFNVA